MRKFTFTVIATLMLAMLQVAIVAQTATTGSLTGTVTDPQGSVVSGANVTLKNNETGAEVTTTSNENGIFRISQVQPGPYTLTIETQGFKKAVAVDIKIQVSIEAKVNIALEVGAPTASVTVTDAQEVINTSNASLTSVINTRQVVDLPLPNRNPLELAALQAGIAVIGTDTRGASVAGLRQTATNVTQDGINAMDNFVKTSSFFAVSTPSLASTAEFSITTGTVGSDSGRGVAQVNMVTKGGTNDFHGGAFLQLINDGYNANTFFNNFNNIPTPLLHQQYYGFDIGGPVMFPAWGEGGPKLWSGKDRAFFFFSYENFNQNRAASRNRNGVLTSTALTGQFSYNRPGGCPNPVPAGQTCVNGVQTINLLTLGSVPFHSLNPIMTAHLAQIPLPNNTNCSASDGFNIGCYAFNVPETTTNDKYVFRYDHQLVKESSIGSHKLEFVYSRVITATHPDVFTNGVEAPFPGGVNAFQESTRNLITPALVSNFGTGWTNVLRYGRQWAPIVFDRDTVPTTPFISLPGVLVNFDNANMPQPRNTTVNQITDSLAWVKGNHLFKFGADWQSVDVFSNNSVGINPTIQLGTNAANGSGITVANFPGLTTNTSGNAIITAATTTYGALVGLLSSASQTLNVTSPTSGFVPGASRVRTFLEKDIAAYAQDQWRFRSNITFNGGIRWDFMGVPTIPNGLAIQPKYADLFGVSGFGNLFNPTLPAGVPGAVATQRFVSGETGIPLFNKDWNNFAPYLGIAYSPNFKGGIGRAIFGEEGKSSIRLGYSISYLRDGLTTISNAMGTGTTNPGLIQVANLSPLGSNPPSSLLLGQLGPGGVPLVTPTFTIPITDRDNILANVNNGLWAIDPNIKTPYVQQWNIGIEREIFKDTALEIRYVGNRALKVWRAVDFNEINIFENGFLAEFNRAKANLAARGTGTSFAPGCVGCVATPLLDKFFAGLAASSGYTSTSFISNLNNNNVGGMAFTLALSSAYRANRENPANGIPMNFFMANPNANFAIGLSNDAMSNYNALEIEIRRRFSSGLQFQADYTWSKAMGDAVDAQGNNQSDLVRFLTLRNKELDYRRSGQDQTWRFVANAIYEMPFGRGKSFFSNANGIVDRIIGGWTMGGIVTWASGVPWFVTSGRTTVTASATNNGADLIGITLDEFKKNTGIFKVDGGVLFINPDLLDLTISPTTGKITASRLKAGLMGQPAPGSFGNFPVNSLSGPEYFNVDFSLIKRIPITERVRLEFKVTAINVLNHPNFAFGSPSFDSSTFGLMTTTRDTGRNMNFLGSIRF